MMVTVIFFPKDNTRIDGSDWDCLQSGQDLLYSAIVIRVINFLRALIMDIHLQLSFMSTKYLSQFLFWTITNQKWLVSRLVEWETPGLDLVHFLLILWVGHASTNTEAKLMYNLLRFIEIQIYIYLHSYEVQNLDLIPS